VVERIRLLLTRFSEDEETVRRLVAADPSFDALCNRYRKVIELLDRFEAEVKRLRKAVESLDRCESEVKRLAQLRASLEEELLARIEGHQPG
jgi:prefoldin subunit 5